ncbi:hypothetical protein SB717_34770, partial [Priestia sp. SIMBA_032]|uniref:hypothetical protein n=1 Tax=Priestia sp. SIMBA_032 TaxID=3085775 RepID=UPI00397DA3E2
ESGLVCADVLDRLGNDEFALLASDKGVRAVARGFIAAAQIRHLDSMLAVYRGIKPCRLGITAIRFCH